MRRLFATCPGSAHFCVAQVYDGFQPSGAVLQGFNYKNESAEKTAALFNTDTH